MRHVVQTILILVCPIALAFSQQERAAEPASIEGVVLRSGSGEPLARAQVTLRKLSGDDSPEVPRYLTQEDGKFTFRNLAPGQYELSAGRNGYARQVYGQRVAGGRGSAINLSGGQVLRGLTLRLVLGGVVTGRVRDSKGEPVA